MSAKDTFIYIFATMSAGGPTSPVKVGISRSVGARLATIQTACPNEICLYYVSNPTTRALAEGFEGLFHALMKDRRLKGEWFSLEPSEAHDAFHNTVRPWIRSATDEELEPLMRRLK